MSGAGWYLMPMRSAASVATNLIFEDDNRTGLASWEALVTMLQAECRGSC